MDSSTDGNAPLLDTASHTNSEHKEDPNDGAAKSKRKAKGGKKEKKNPNLHIPLRSNIGPILCKYKWHLLVMALTILATVLCNELIDTSNVTDETKVLTWESYVSINFVMAAILLMLIGFPPDLVLIVMSVSLTLIPCSRTECYKAYPNSNNTGYDCTAGPYTNSCTIISMKQAWKGFTSTSVLSIGVLFMVAKGVEKTGIISYLAQFVLGDPR